MSGLFLTGPHGGPYGLPATLREKPYCGGFALLETDLGRRTSSMFCRIRLTRTSPGTVAHDTALSQARSCASRPIADLRGCLRILVDDRDWLRVLLVVRATTAALGVRRTLLDWHRQRLCRCAAHYSRMATAPSHAAPKDRRCASVGCVVVADLAHYGLVCGTGPLGTRGLLVAGDDLGSADGGP